VIDATHAVDFFELSDGGTKAFIGAHTNPAKPGAYAHDKFLSTLRRDGSYEITALPWGALNLSKFSFSPNKGRPAPAEKPFAVEIHAVKTATPGKAKRE